MHMNVIDFAAIMPHPPILIPEVGKNRLKEAKLSKKALEEVSRKIKKANSETIIVITPHGEVGQASVPVYTSHVFEGNFAHFGQAKPNFSFKGDPELGLALVKNCDFASTCPETLLDHGALVPLYYIQAAGFKKQVLPIAIAFKSLVDLFEFGKCLAKTVKQLGRKVTIVASADMSHRLTNDAPSGYSPRGKEFDEKLVQLVKEYNVKEILNFDPALADEAGQDALWSIAILFGALDGLDIKTEVLSYEGPFGVGYMIASLEIT